MPEHSATASTHQQDIRWYQQFWPWFLIILPGIVVVASLVTVYIAFKGADNLVAKDYYKEGLAINKTVDDLKAAKAMEMKATLDFSGHILKVSLATKSSLEDNPILLTLQHPFDANKDVALIMQKSSSNEFTSTLPNLEKGKWYITLQSTSTSQPWRLTLPAYLPQSQIIIRPE